MAAASASSPFLSLADFHFPAFLTNCTQLLPLNSPNTSCTSCPRCSLQLVTTACSLQSGLCTAQWRNPAGSASSMCWGYSPFWGPASPSNTWAPGHLCTFSQQGNESSTPGPQDHVRPGLCSAGGGCFHPFSVFPFLGRWFSGQLLPGLTITLILSKKDALAQKPLSSLDTQLLSPAHR